VRPLPRSYCRYSLGAIREIGGAVPQQRKLIIRTSDKTKHQSTVVTLSDSAEKELKKAIAQAKAHGGQIVSIDLRKS
jgi:hypothetical protein